jgi:hypothetical protein
MIESPLRDLARKLDEVASAHICAPQVTALMGHVRDCLSAMAFHEETCQLDAIDVLPCDVSLPPATIIRKGCSISALVTALRVRMERQP